MKINGVFLVTQCLLSFLFVNVGQAQTKDAFPNKPLKIIVTYPAGGPTDAVARILAPRLSIRFGQTVIVENKSGAAGKIGTLEVVRSNPDGYTVGLIAPTLSVNPSLYSKMSFDTFKDLVGITQHVGLQYALITNKNFPAKNATEFVALAKSSAKPLSYGTWGIGSHAHLAGALLAQKLGVEMLHVPYKGAAPAMQDLIGGQFDFMFDSVASSIPQIKGGNVKVLALSGTYPITSLPSVPSLGQTVQGFDVIGWQGIVAPAKTPPAIIDRWYSELAAVLREPEIESKLNDIGLTVVASKPQEFNQFIVSEFKKYEAIIKAAGIVGE
jgi:tripartite-type tricarboxylate transporter receptor subunit TctC